MFTALMIACVTANVVALPFAMFNRDWTDCAIHSVGALAGALLLMT